MFFAFLAQICCFELSYFRFLCIFAVRWVAFLSNQLHGLATLLLKENAMTEARFADADTVEGVILALDMSVVGVERCNAIGQAREQKKFIFCVNSACIQYVKRTFFLNYTNKPD